MVTAEVQRLQNLIATREKLISEQTAIAKNLLSPRTGLKIEVVEARRREGNNILSNLVGLKESLGDLKSQLLEEQLKPDIQIEELINNGGIIPELSVDEIIQVQPQDNTLRNALLVGGALLLIL